jgi:hypothetical protein
MHNWTGSRIQEEALTVYCRYCKARKGDVCKGIDGKDLQAFPAHTVRITDARVAQQAEREANA